MSTLASRCRDRTVRAVPTRWPPDARQLAATGVWFRQRAADPSPISSELLKPAATGLAVEPDATTNQMECLGRHGPA